MNNNANTPKITLTPTQQRVLDHMLRFIDSSQQVFILTGYAGTGKTTMMNAFVAELVKRDVQHILMASTGRAAKILSNRANCKATTVHSNIYTFNDFNRDIGKMAEQLEKQQLMESDGQLLLQFTPMSIEPTAQKHVYIIDEASMISDEEDRNPTQALFGSGRVLHDLLTYDPSGKFLFVGDECQLPPIGQPFSPALSPQYFREKFNIEAVHYQLTQIMRQQSDNDIIVAANKIRQLYQDPPLVKWGKFPLRNRKHVRLYPSQLQLLNAYIRNIKDNGFNSATLICGTNRLCLSLTNLIRPSLGFNQPVLMPGELLLVTQNNCLSGLMNGDLVKVLQLGTRKRRAGLTFLEVEVEELFTHRVVKQMLIEDILYSALPNLKQYDQQALFIDYYHRMKDRRISHKSQVFKDFMLTDPYLNAIRAVFGYALTCHKAQGGEWKDVYLDIPRKFSFETSKPEYQWVYTAVTRAADQLHIVDDFFIA